MQTRLGCAERKWTPRAQRRSKLINTLALNFIQGYMVERDATYQSCTTQRWCIADSIHTGMQKKSHHASTIIRFQGVCHNVATVQFVAAWRSTNVPSVASWGLERWETCPWSFPKLCYRDPWVLRCTARRGQRGLHQGCKRAIPWRNKIFRQNKIYQDSKHQKKAKPMFTQAIHLLAGFASWTPKMNGMMVQIHPQVAGTNMHELRSSFRACSCISYIVLVGTLATFQRHCTWQTSDDWQEPIYCWDCIERAV